MKPLSPATAAVFANPRRIFGENCPTCTAPIGTWPRCQSCASQVSSGSPLADRVIPLSWSISGKQSATDMELYKQSPKPSTAALRRLHELFGTVLNNHSQCLLPASYNRGIAVVPSTGTTPKVPHPLEQFASRLPGYTRCEAVFTGTRTSSRATRRTFAPGSWTINTGGQQIDHLLVLDDLWVTGAHAQSVASAAKTAGIPTVTIFTLSRLIDPTFSISDQFISAYPLNPYDAQICPMHDIIH